MLDGNAANPAAPTSARDSGCLVRTDAADRADRPSSTSRRASAICADSSESISEASYDGHDVRCTDSGASPGRSTPHT